MIFYKVKTCQASSNLYFNSEIEAKKYIIKKELNYLEDTILKMYVDVDSFIINYMEYINYYNELHALINKSKFHEAYEVLYKYNDLNYVEDKSIVKCRTIDAKENKIHFFKRVHDIIMTLNKVMVFK